jgi:hypothetical protein
MRNTAGTYEPQAVDARHAPSAGTMECWNDGTMGANAAQPPSFQVSNCIEGSL